MAEATILPLVNSVIRHIHGRRFRNLSEDTATIQQILESFCDAIKDADAKRHSHEEIPFVTLTDVKTALYDLDDAVYEVYPTISRYLLWRKSFTRFFQIGTSSRESREKLLVLLNKIKTFDLTPHECSLEISMPIKQTSMIQRSSFFNENNSCVIQREEDKHELISKLLDLSHVEGPSVVVVVGMGGIGKTTLAKLVYADEATHCFHTKLWVSCSPHPDVSVRRILCGIAEALKLDIALSESKAMLVDMITSSLKNTRYLLVLDDVRVESGPFWVELKSVLDVGETGSAILITTKNNNVASSAQSVIIYDLKCLSDSACLNIFEQTAFRKGEADEYPMLRKIGARILSKWDRVPLVAVFFGNLLRDERDEGTWLQIGSMAIRLRNNSVVSLLKLCYENLPSHLKPCFAFLALSQGDPRNFVPHQIYFWSAFGLFQTSDQLDDIADIERCGQNYMRELSKSILHDSELTFGKRTVSSKLHYLVCDLATELLGEDLAVITWNKLKVSYLSRHIIWGCDEIDMLADKDFPEELLKAKGARTFRFGYFMGRISKSFLEGIISNLHYLRILDLGFSHFEELPLMIGDLIHLRVLNLSFNLIIRYLPRTVHKLINLQAFFLEGCVQLQELPLKLHKLKSLQCFVVTTCQQSLNGIKLIGLPALQELQFVSCKNLENLRPLDSIGSQNSLRRLHFYDCPLLTRLPQGLFNIQELVIDKCELMDLKVGGGPSLYTNLRSLEISGVQACYFLQDGSSSVPMKLEYLLLRDCEQLDTFPEDLFDWFLQLQSFAIDNCRLLKTLPSSIRNIKCLEELNIKECPYLSSWCKTDKGISRIYRIPQIILDGRPFARDTMEEPAFDNEASGSVQISEIHATEIGASEISEIAEIGASEISEIAEIGASEILKLPESGSKEELELHFHLFPNSYEFEREMVVQLWMASSYFRTGHMEESARRYFDCFLREKHILHSRSDNLSGTDKYIINVGKIGDVSSDGLYIMLNDENTVAEETKHQHVSVVSPSINHTIFETLKKFIELRTLLFIGNYGPALNQIPSDMFLALPRMETLDLSGSHITELPSSIGNATQLRYLDLSFTLIKRLPETIDRLVELQTLKLNGCKKLFTLPKGMKKLVSLRHLYFDVLGQLSSMPSGIGALTELRTLSAFIVDVGEGCNIKELREMNNLTGSCCISGLESVLGSDTTVFALLNKKYLTQIQLRWDGCGVINAGHVDVYMGYLEPHSCLEKLEVFNYPNSRLPRWICDEKFKNLTKITFLKCTNSELNTPLGQLPNLKNLDIIQMNRVKTVDRHVHAEIGYVSFPKLEKLTIDGMSILASWTPIDARDFPLLSEVTIKRCPNICALPFLEFLGSLTYLEISHCTALEFPFEVNLPEKLQSLMIDSCPLLKTKFLTDDEYRHKIGHVSEILVDFRNLWCPSEDDSEDIEDIESSDEEVSTIYNDYEDVTELESSNEETEELENGDL